MYVRDWTPPPPPQDGDAQCWDMLRCTLDRFLIKASEAHDVVLPHDAVEEKACVPLADVVAAIPCPELQGSAPPVAPPCDRRARPARLRPTTLNAPWPDEAMATNESPLRKGRKPCPRRSLRQRAWRGRPRGAPSFDDTRYDRPREPDERSSQRSAREGRVFVFLGAFSIPPRRQALSSH